MYLELRHLRTLSVIRDTGSLVQAAERMHLTQSALSHQVKALEDHFGLALFVRKSRPLLFTPAGLRLLQLADRVLPAAAETERDLGRLAGGQAGRLQIAIECHSCFEWLMPTMDQFREHWPEVELDIVTNISFEPLPALIRHEVDLVITADPIPDTAIHYEQLFRYQSMLVMAKNHPLAAKTHIEPQDLAQEVLITYPVEHERLDIYKHFLGPAGVEPAAVRVTQLTAMIMQLVASRRGVAALPNWVISEYLARDYVAARPLGRESVWCTLFAALRKEDTTLPFMVDFIDLSRETSFRILSGIRGAEESMGDDFD